LPKSGLLALLCQYHCQHGTARFPVDGISWTLTFSYFSKIGSRKLKFDQILTRITGTLHATVCTFIIIPRCVLLRMRRFTEDAVEKFKTHILWSVTSFSKNCAVYGVMCKKHGRAMQATGENILRRMRFAYLVPKVTYLLTPWCRFLLEKLTGLQLVKKFPAFHATRRFITALTSVRHLSLSWAKDLLAPLISRAKGNSRHSGRNISLFPFWSG